MDFGLRDKRILVTASGRGLGRAMVLALAREGARVAYVARSAPDIDHLRETLGEFDNTHFGLALDLEPEDGPRRLISGLQGSGFGELDGIVHNLGGTLNINDPFCQVKDWRRVWRLNLEIAIELNLCFLPGMMERGWGRIVHVSSISSIENHGPIPYCAAKAGLNAYTRSLGRVVARKGVTVSAVLPGAVWTEGGYWDTASRERPEHVENFVKDRMAIGRLGQPEEIAGIVAFLCSNQASFFVGSIVPVDGGHGRSFFGT